jgi:hypothetical protein
MMSDEWRRGDRRMLNSGKCRKDNGVCFEILCEEFGVYQKLILYLFLISLVAIGEWDCFERRELADRLI